VNQTVVALTVISSSPLHRELPRHRQKEQGSARAVRDLGFITRLLSSSAEMINGR